MKTDTNHKIKNIRIGITCCAVTVSILLGIYLIRYQFFLNGLEHYKRTTSPDYKEREYLGLSQRQTIILGRAQQPSHEIKNSYLNIAKEKQPGIIRIGFFGCSFTKGSETAIGYDFPSILQDRLRQVGVEHVEVINFGVGGYGMHSSYLLWKYLGQEYNLDYVIFTLFDFHVERDSSFISPGRSYMPIRARYILKNDRLELIEVLGQNRREAASIYHQIIPRWRYLRYDRVAPPFLRSLIPVGRELRFNPFYYLANVSEEDEILQTYLRLFEELSGKVKHLIVIVNDEFGVRLSEEASS